MINKNIIIGLVASAVIIGGIFLVLKGKAVSVAGTNDMIVERDGSVEFQVDADFPKNTADFTNGDTALRSFGQASYKAAP